MNHLDSRSRITWKLGLLWMAVALVAACDTTPRTSDRDLELIDHQRLVALLRDGKKPAVLIDVRSADKFAQGHIPGAINIPLPELRRNDPRLAEAHRLIVYADGWNDILSPAAAKKLIVLGYSGVYDYRGGMESWKMENAAVVVEEGT